MRLQIQLFILSCLAFAETVQAQVGIGTASPNASAQLEVNSSSKGFCHHGLP